MVGPSRSATTPQVLREWGAGAARNHGLRTHLAEERSGSSEEQGLSRLCSWSDVEDRSDGRATPSKERGAHGPTAHLGQTVDGAESDLGPLRDPRDPIRGRRGGALGSSERDPAKGTPRLEGRCAATWRSPTRSAGSRARPATSTGAESQLAKRRQTTETQRVANSLLGLSVSDAGSAR